MQIIAKSTINRWVNPYKTIKIMSIRLEKNNSTTDQAILVTLHDGFSGTTTGETFYFEFEFEQTGDKLSKTLTDVSNYPVRYNLFNVKTSGETSNVIPFVLEGWYKYSIYKQSGETLLEIGKCLVYDTQNPVENKYSPTISKYVYKKQ